MSSAGALRPAACPSCSMRSASTRHTRVGRAQIQYPVRAAAGDSGPTLQRPGARQIAEPQAPSRPEPKQEQPGSSRPSSTPPPPSTEPSGITVEYQRRQAKDMTAYFRSVNRTELVQKSQVFGWTRKNEIANGRWVMFGLLVGLMTEYATGVNFPNQIKLLVSYLGIADIYE